MKTYLVKEKDNIAKVKELIGKHGGVQIDRIPITLYEPPYSISQREGFLYEFPQKGAAYFLTSSSADIGNFCGPQYYGFVHCVGFNDDEPLLANISSDLEKICEKG